MFLYASKTRLNNSHNFIRYLDWKGIANGHAVYFTGVLSAAVTAYPNRPIIPTFQLHLRSVLQTV